jgi:N-acetylglucosaminyldiphosphoundecaprenol N-acetyl-beta-D-mannosaminyltransferase
MNSERSLSTQTINMFGMTIDAVDMPTAVGTVLQWCRGTRAEACRYVVTPNVDHAVMYQSHVGLRQAYDEASLVLADGAPVVLAARLLRKNLPERVAGSDLVPALFDAVDVDAGNVDTADEKPLRVFLLGAGPGVADRAATAIEQRWPGVEVVGTHSPPLGFEQVAEENAKIMQAVSICQPDIVLVGLGAPKQELWVHRHAEQLEAKAALCIGATIDFLAGEKNRSPRWMRRLGLEWLHRVASEPSRLAKRYLRDAWIFPQLVWRQWRAPSSH